MKRPNLAKLQAQCDKWNAALRQRVAELEREAQHLRSESARASIERRTVSEILAGTYVSGLPDEADYETPLTEQAIATLNKLAAAEADAARKLLEAIDDADNDMGIYPAAVKGYNDERDYEQRDGFKNGWNAACMEFVTKVRDIAAAAMRQQAGGSGGL